MTAGSSTNFSEVFNRPPLMSKYREGVNVNAKGPEKIDVAKQFFKEHMSSMHTGTTYQCFVAWMDETTLWAIEKPSHGRVRATGPIEITEAYNTMTKLVVGGPHGTLTANLQQATYHSNLDVVRLEVMISVLRSGSTTPVVERKRFTIKFKANMIIERLIDTPRGAGTIRPVKKQARESSGKQTIVKRTEVALPPSLQLPTYDRPCLHNNWDPVRVKRGNSLLRCRVCGSQWKLPVQKVSRCRRYLSDGCNKGSLCTALHVNGRKLTYAQRTGDENQSA